MKYFFHVLDGQAYTDREGAELPSLQQARVEAVRILADFLGQKPEAFWRDDGFALTVQDARRVTLFTLQLTVVPAGRTEDDQGIPVVG